MKGLPVLSDECFVISGQFARKRQKYFMTCYFQQVKSELPSTDVLKRSGAKKNQIFSPTLSSFKQSREKVS